MAKLPTTICIKVDHDWLRLVAYASALRAIAELSEWDSAEAVQIAREMLEALPPELPDDG